MSNDEIQILTDIISKKERDLVVCEQAMINFSAMLRDSEYKPALLQHASKEIDSLIEMVYDDIKNIKDKRTQNEKTIRI